MAVKRCPNCGDLYLAAVDICADCGATLEEVEPEAPAETAESDSGVHRPDTSGDHDEWDLGSWTMEGRRLLDGMLANSQIPRSWQGSTLFTPEAARDQVDDLVATVSASDAQVGAGDDVVGYEISDWTEDALDRLVSLLQRDRVPYRWDADGDLEVDAEYEVTVDAIFSELSGESSDGEGGADGDDMAGHEALSEIFVASDRLARNPADAIGARSLAEIRPDLAGMAVPFGISPKLWTGMVERVEELHEMMGDPATEAEVIEARAAAIRDLLRDLV